MDLSNSFYFSTHQFFLLLLILFFSIYFLIEHKNYQEKIKKNIRKKLVFFFITLFLGICCTYLLNFGSYGLFFSIEFSIIIILSFIDQKYAIGFFIFLLISRPWEFFENSMMLSIPRDFFLIVLFTILFHKIIKKEFFIKINVGTFIALLFCMWGFFSAFQSSQQAMALNEFYELLIKGNIIFLLIQNSISHAHDFILPKLSLVFAIIEKGFISYYLSLDQIQGSDLRGDFVVTRLESVGILGNSNDIAAILIMVFPFCLAITLKYFPRPLNWLIAFMFSLGILKLIWMTQSRGAILGLASLTTAFICIHIKQKKYFALISIISILGAYATFSTMKRDTNDLNGSSQNRLIFWKAGLNMGLRNPIFGVGVNQFDENFASYAFDGDLGSEGSHMTAHSSWVQVFAEMGVLGFFIFLGLWLYGGYQAWKIKHYAPELFVSIVGYATSVTFLSHSYLLFPYILLAIAIQTSRCIQFNE